MHQTQQDSTVKDEDMLADRTSHVSLRFRCLSAEYWWDDW
jgi:hypothetical protein